MDNAAADLAKANIEKDRLAKELTDIHLQIAQLEKRKEWLKGKLEPLMTEGERIGLVAKEVRQNLVVDDTLLATLEARFGAGIVKRSVNTPVLRKYMAEDAALDQGIPRKKQVTLRVGEAWDG